MFEKITLAVFNNKCFYLFNPYLSKESNKRSKFALQCQIVILAVPSLFDFLCSSQPK